MEVLDFDSFSALITQLCVKSKTYSRMIDQMEVMDTISTIESLGDDILNHSRHGRLSEELARSLLMRLVGYSADPLNKLREVLAIQRELKELK